MKNNILKYKLQTLTLLVCTLTFFSSCRDFLYVEPTNQLTINSFSDVKRLLGGSLRNYQEGNNYLSGVPNVITSYDEYLITNFYSDDCNTDKYLDTWMGQNNKGDFNKSLTWKNPDIHESIWGTYYKAIGFYNLILAELRKHNTSNKVDAERVEGEARVTRAYCFFHLVQLFAPYTDNLLGLPLNTDPDKVGTYDSRRQTQTENYAFIISELETALNFGATPEPEYNIFYNKTFIKGLLAQVYLYKAASGAKDNNDYAKASQYAKEVLASGITFNDIKTTPDKADDFGVLASKKFAPLMFLYSDGQKLQDIVGNNNYGLPQYPSDDLYALYTDNDLRKKEFFTEGKGIIKFDSDFPWSYIRFNLCSGAEMKLIIAEAEARQGHNDIALKELKEFAATRYTNYVEPTHANLLQSILDERRKEFCFEPYIRWFDMRRLGVELSRKPRNKQEDPKAYKLAKDDFRYTMPIPKKGELKDNNIDQNPGWNNF